MADIISGFREVVQDLLVPELKAVQTEIKHLNERIGFLSQEMERRFVALQEEMDKRFEAVDKRFEAVNRQFEAVNKRFEAVDRELVEIKLNLVDLRKGQQAILEKLDLDKRVRQLEFFVQEISKKLNISFQPTSG